MYETTKCSQWNIRTILQCSLQAYARMSTPANMGAQPDWQRGSAWGPVILPVFKTGGRQVFLSPVGSTPTRFRQNKALARVPCR